jgi:hypothetical protein
MSVGLAPLPPNVNRPTDRDNILRLSGAVKLGRIAFALTPTPRAI